MKCEVCGKEYKSKYFFKDLGNSDRLICSRCVDKEELDQQKSLELLIRSTNPDDDRCAIAINELEKMDIWEN